MVISSKPSGRSRYSDQNSATPTGNNGKRPMDAIVLAICDLPDAPFEVDILAPFGGKEREKKKRKIVASDADGLAQTLFVGNHRE